MKYGIMKSFRKIVCCFSIFHIWLVLVFFRNYIFILMISALSILLIWHHNDIKYFKIQDFTKDMNVMRLERFFFFHWCHCIAFYLYFLFYFAFHSLAYVCLMALKEKLKNNIAYYHRLQKHQIIQQHKKEPKKSNKRYF